MEPIFDQQDEDQEYLIRREKRKQRMLREKKRKQKRILIAKLTAAGILSLAIIGGGISFLSGIAKEAPKKEKNEIKQEDTDIQLTPEATPAAPEVTQSEEASSSEVEASGFSSASSLPIRFETTENTGSIYHEEVNSTYGILVNANDGTITATRQANARISPASMTKVLTVLVAAENITKEQLDDTFTMTLDITDYSYSNDCSSVGFLDQEQIKVIDLFYGTILPSGGDAAVGLATYVAGSHEKFVEMMNEKLKELGLDGTAHFTNCVGLYDENHYCTPYDMAVIMKAAMDNELCKKILGEKVYTTTPTPEHPEGITISNWFIRRIEDKDTGGLVIGAKTGFVVESGNCAVSCNTQENGTTYICVTAGAYNSWRCIYDHVEIYNTYTKK